MKLLNLYRTPVTLYNEWYSCCSHLTRLHSYFGGINKLSESSMSCCLFFILKFVDVCNNECDIIITSELHSFIILYCRHISVQQNYP